MEQQSIHMPISLNKIKKPQLYLEAFICAVNEEDALDDLLDFEAVDLEFGAESSLHVLTVCAIDLSILMTPENDGWKAERVYLGFCQKSKKRLEGSGMVFRFKYPSKIYNEGKDEYGIIYDEDAFVYSN